MRHSTDPISPAIRLCAGALLLLGVASAQWSPEYGTRISDADDELVTVHLPVPLPLTGGATTSTLRISTNGFVYLDGSSTDPDPTNTVAEFLTGDARIAVYWDDLTATAGYGVDPPGVYLRFVAAGSVQVTWLMREVGSGMRVQAQLFYTPQGIIRVSYAAAGSGDPLVGITPGNGAADPGSRTLSVSNFANLPTTFYQSFQLAGFDLVGSVLDLWQTPTSYFLRVQPSQVAGGQVDPVTTSRGNGCAPGPGQPPIAHTIDPVILGSTPIASATALPANALISGLHVGLDRSNLPLDPIGMPGCTAYTSALVAVLPMTPEGNSASVSLGEVPYFVPRLVGTGFTTQALSVVPGANALNILVSNAQDSQIGYW